MRSYLNKRFYFWYMIDGAENPIGYCYTVSKKKKEKLIEPRQTEHKLSSRRRGEVDENSSCGLERVDIECAG